MAERQPVLLTTGEANVNNAQALFLIDGADPGDLAGYTRCLVLFDGKDEGQLSLARRQWSALKAGGAALSYWKQSGEGRWEKAQ
jgi:DNA polymerase-3 subunit chi